MVLVANIGILSDSQITSLENMSNWAFLIAFVGLGLEIKLDEFRSIGYRPVLVVLIGMGIVATTMLLLVRTLF